MVWDVTEQDAAGGFRLGQIDRDKARARLNVNTSSTANRPSFFSLQYKEGANSTLGLEITLHEVPTDVRSYAVDCYLPQGYLDSTVDDDTVIQVPSRPLILGAYMLALNERGEELGEPGGLIEQRFLEAKDDSIQTDLDAAANLNLLDVATD
jgi:hypothetical protein